MTYLIEKAASAYVTEKADGLNIEESFFLYILAQNWANGDEFSWACGGVEEEWVSLVEEARWSFQKNRSWEGFLTRLKPTVKDMMQRGITFSMEYEARGGEFRKRNPPPSLYKSLSISKVIHIYICIS